MGRVPLRRRVNIHGALLNEIGAEDLVLGSERPLTVAPYFGGAVVEAFVEEDREVFGMAFATATVSRYSSGGQERVAFPLSGR